MRAYSKRRDLADVLVSAVRQLRQADGRGGEPGQSVHSTPLGSRQWRVGDQLSQDDRAQLLAAFTAGTPKRQLAEQYGISESSVKRLIRHDGAPKPSCGLSQLVAASPVGGVSGCVQFPEADPTSRMPSPRVAEGRTCGA